MRGKQSEAFVVGVAHWRVIYKESEEIEAWLARGDKRAARSYDVFLGDCHIGRVWNGSVASYRETSTGVRLGLIGYRMVWASKLEGIQWDYCTETARTRREAARVLIEEYLDMHPWEQPVTGFEKE